MRCGTKQFIVQYEDMETKEQKEKLIYARTPAHARKNIRMQCGEKLEIFKVMERNRKSE